MKIARVVAVARAVLAAGEKSPKRRSSRRQPVLPLKRPVHGSSRRVRSARRTRLRIRSEASGVIYENALAIPETVGADMIPATKTRQNYAGDIVLRIIGCRRGDAGADHANQLRFGRDQENDSMPKLSTDARKRPVTGASQRAAILVLAASLSGCYADRQVVDNYPNDVRQRHPIAIHEGTRTLDLFVGVHRGSLNPSQHANLAAFVHRWRREATGGFIIEVPVGTNNAAAAAAAAREIQAILAAGGVPPHAVITRRYRPADPMRLATVRVIYPKMIAEAGPCGLWPHDIGPSLDGADFQNREYWNLGCADQRNLAAMVENPADLVQPRGDAPEYAARRSTVLEKYRKGENPATVYPTDTSKISDVSK